MSWNGYLFLYLRKNGKKKFFLVHRIVALSFLKNEKNLPTVNHKNTKKTDNRVKNLEWMSYSGQQLHLKKERTRDRRGRFI